VPRPASLRTMVAVAASLLGILYVADRGVAGRTAGELATQSAQAATEVARASMRPRPMPRIYSAPLRSPAVVTVVSMASNAEWMSPPPSAPPPPVFAPVMVETVAFVR
jgi:hypothetical protein